jgi:putative CocE/NonD family hydrolase
LNARRRLERRWLGLPPARSSLLESSTWMPAADGVRLATRVWRPADPSVRLGTVLIRTERPLGDGRAQNPIEKLGRWLAEDGRTVAIQSCRGRDASEGEFRPFADEVADGDCALRWLADQPWFDGKQGGLQGLVLLGLGYSAFTAWAALSAASAQVAALVTGFGARDPYAWLYPGGVLQLEAALALAARLDGRIGFEPAALDLERAARHRPLGECDRVALRELTAFRSWLEHPRRDAWWSERTPALPDRLPRALFVSGWYECALSAAYADFEAAAKRAAESDLNAPALVLGPWGAAPLPREERTRGTRDIAEVARSVLRFVAHAVGARPVRDLPRRVFVRGAGWRELGQWPPEAASDHTLYLRGGGRANSLDGDGRLAPDPPGDDRADTFVADPADPVPSLGGAAVAGVAGPVDQRAVERRGDVLCFTSEPLVEALELSGRVVLTVHTGNVAGPDDTSAKLVAVEPGGAARWLCEGITRAVPGTAADAVEIDLGVAGVRLAAGTQLRLELAASSVPRFARPEQGGRLESRPTRSPQGREAAAQRGEAERSVGPREEGQASEGGPLHGLANPMPRVRTVYHDGERPSALRFRALPVR